MHDKLSQALTLLNFDPTKRPEQIHALFEYLHLAGYLSPILIEKSVDYLHAAYPFAKPSVEIKTHLLGAYANANQAHFKSNVFLNEFAKEACFTSYDIIDLIVFMCQTAYARAYGEERDSLTAEPWLVEHADRFIQLAKSLDILQGKAPQHNHYLGVAVMGTVTSRFQSRLEYFKSLPPCYDSAWALSGARQLKLGLDQEDEMRAIAEYYHVPFALNGDKNCFLAISETQMVNYYISTRCKDISMQIIDSPVEENHWRATTKQTARDLANMIIDQIISAQLPIKNDTHHYFMIIAEQPYINRMQRQVQREFNCVLQENDLTKIKIIIEGCGPSVKDDVLQSPCDHLKMLSCINSELAAKMLERLKDARQAQPTLSKRDISALTFRDRDIVYQKFSQNAE